MRDSSKMETIDPQLAGGLALMGGIGFTMVWLGMRMHALEQRHEPRRCPSCGLRVRRGVPCGCSR